MVERTLAQVDERQLGQAKSAPRTPDSRTSFVSVVLVTDLPFPLSSTTMLGPTPISQPSLWSRYWSAWSFIRKSA